MLSAASKRPSFAANAASSSVGPHSRVAGGVRKVGRWMVMHALVSTSAAYVSVR
jgi:hypothetical protein